MKHRKDLAAIHARFFRPEKSPHTHLSINIYTGLPEYTYRAKHDKMKGCIIYDSMRLGTFRGDFHKTFNYSNNK